jgi:SulP family sulfate permease
VTDTSIRKAAGSFIPAAALPKSIQCLRGYDGRTFAADLVAGVTVGLVALPLAMAFAISSGVPPQAGLYCAVVAGFLISALGGSRCQIGGPTGAFVVVVSGIVAHHGVGGLFLCTIMAGIMLIVLGATGLGSAVDYIPRPVIVGFTNGIAVLIASTQIKDFLGLDIAAPSSVFLPRMVQVFRALPTIDWITTAVAVLSLVLVIAGKRWVRRIPGPNLALFAGTLGVALLGLTVETVGTRFGGVPSGWPSFSIPEIRPGILTVLISPAITVAMLGAIESLMSAVVADRMSGDRHNPNTELIAQGVANIASPLFGGLPATGAIARTATSIRSGARTPVAGIVHALTLLAILLFAAPLARFVPLAVLAAILFVVAWHMGDWAEIREILKLSRADISVWLVTFALTVFADLTVAVEAGMILAALLFIRKVSATTTVSEITPAEIERDRVHVLQGKQIPDYVTIFRIHGPFLFGTTDKLEPILDRIPTLPPIVILRLRNMTAIDATGLSAIEALADRLEESGRTLIVCGARRQPSRLMSQAEFHEHVGRANICHSVEEALDRARALHAA